MVLSALATEFYPGRENEFDGLNMEELYEIEAAEAMNAALAELELEEEMDAELRGAEKAVDALAPLLDPIIALFLQNPNLVLGLKKDIVDFEESRLMSKANKALKQPRQIPKPPRNRRLLDNKKSYGRRHS